MLLAAGIFFILQLFGISFRARLLLSLIILFIYTFITGANPPVVRSTIMYFIFSLGFFLKRKVNQFNSLGLAGFICLLINPLWLFDAGFQLSYLSVFALIVGFKVLPIESCQNRIISYAKYTFFASLWVSLFIAPLISLYFGRIYFLSVLHNIILIPFFSFITMLIFVLIAISPLSFAAISLGEVINIAVILFMKTAQLLGSIPLTFIDYRFSWRQVIVYYLILGSLLLFWKRLTFRHDNLNI